MYQNSNNLIGDRDYTCPVFDVHAVSMEKGFCQSGGREATNDPYNMGDETTIDWYTY